MPSESEGHSRTYDREKLYEEVWAEPMVKVAKRYGVSDVALSKACRRMGIPVPPRGYWAKFQAGKRVRRAPLPPGDGTVVPRKSVLAWRQKDAVVAEPEEPLAFLPEDVRAQVQSFCAGLTADKALRSPHALIKQDRTARAARRQWEGEQADPLSWRGWREPPPGHDAALPRLAIHVVSNDGMQRAYRLLSPLFRAIESLGGSVSAGESTRVTLCGDPVKIQVTQRNERLSLVIDEYDSPRKSWNDGKVKRVEQELGAFLIGICECSHLLKAGREEQERKRRERRLAEKRRHDRAKRQHEEYARYTALENAAMDWQKARVIGDYLTALREHAETVEDGDRREALLQQIAWGLEKVAWLDPLVGRVDEVLGKRRHGRPEDEKVALEHYDPSASFGDVSEE